MQRDIIWFGIPIIKIRKTENYEKRYFLGIQYKIRKYARRYQYFEEAFIENASFIKNRKIQVVLNNLGEAVIYARTAKFWYQKGSIVFGTRMQHAEIFKMFAPQIPVFFCGEGALLEPITVNGNIISPILADKKLIEINNEGQSFWKQWEKYLQADFDKVKLKKAIITKSDEESALNKIKILGIDIKKFIFFIPRARSLDLLPNSFWKDLENYLKNKGYDIVYNSKMFTLSEAYVLARYAKAIIALRSGFNDILSEIETPQFLIYSHNSWHEDLQPMYSLFNFPWAAKKFITEYNTHTQSLNEIKTNILNKIERR